MKITKRTPLILSLILLSVLGCAPKIERRSSAVATIASEINKESEEIAAKQETTTSEVDLEKITDTTYKSVTLKDFGQSFCELMNQKNLDNPFELEKHISSQARANRFMPQLKALNQSASCSGVRTIVNLYPIQIFEIELAISTKLFFLLQIDPSKKISNMAIVFGENLSVEAHRVEMRDGAKLFSLVIQELGAKKPFIVSKSPYLNQNPISYFTQFSRFKDKGYNFVIQANRGSFNSDGDFKWLHVENIEDARDTLDWISSLETSNQKTLPYGVSYDGFNSLTFAATNHDSLIGAISCSSPASARTDSLTGNESPTFSYLDYINHRETSDSASLLYQKAAYLLEKNPTLFEDMDQELFGRKLADWQDYVSGVQNGDQTYFEKRNLYPSLIATKTPIFHVAGLKDDQDSRDTILTYFNLLGKVPTDQKNPHYLYLHGGGHSCGDVLESEGFKALVAGNLEEIPRTQQYSLNDRKMKTIENYRGTIDTWKSFALDLSVDNYFRETNLLKDEVATLVADIPSNYSPTSTTTASITATEDMILNGAGSIDLSVVSYAYGVNLIGALSVTDRFGATKFVNQKGYWGAQYSQRFNKEDFGKPKTVRITLPPDLKFIAKGDKINLTLSLYSPYTFDYLKTQRIAHYKETIGVEFGLIYILKENPPTLNLPIEIPVPQKESEDEAEAEELASAP